MIYNSYNYNYTEADELTAIDKKTRKLMAMNGALDPRIDMYRLYAVISKWCGKTYIFTDSHTLNKLMLFSTVYIYTFLLSIYTLSCL